MLKCNPFSADFAGWLFIALDLIAAIPVILGEEFSFRSLGY
ncbi:hypothetical protein ANOBCDAF_03737 [Pleomorphomonas sp. T1.2MG-36]|nr:hypothetical protein ANOBCDAF_03737 [Pleomorphomonas sp. T1.2MG-36]